MVSNASSSSPPSTAWQRDEAFIAANLRDYANLLEEQQADGFRVSAYRRAADFIETMNGSLFDVFAEGGTEALIALPTIGRAIGAAIAEMLTGGRWSQLERLSGSVDAETIFRTVPGIGEALALRIADDLHIDSLEALEATAHDGTLAGVPGFGPRRLQMVQSALAERLGRRRPDKSAHGSARPPVSLILDVDRDYREQAAAGVLRTIAPKRFNPEQSAWLPILHTQRGPWHFTVLFSNTRRAHDLDRTKDWVVIFYQSDMTPEGQCTVVTERSGPHAGQRVVRGREPEEGGLGASKSRTGG